MEIDSEFVIFDCKPDGDNMKFSGAQVFSKTLVDGMASVNHDLESSYEAIHSLLDNRMWLVHDRIHCSRLVYGCSKIGKPPPTATSIIDTSLFTSSKTKLARAAVMFGLGRGSSPWDYQANLYAILTCKEIMSAFDVPMKTLNGTLHPMLYYLMQYNDQMNDEVRARYFNEAEYPSFQKCDDLSIMPLVEYVQKKRNDELWKRYDEIEKQQQEYCKHFNDDYEDDEYDDDEDDG